MALDKEKKHELTPHYCLYKLRRDLVNGKSYALPGTDGTFLSCLYLHVLYEHTLLGICFTHSLDPFTRKERFLFFVNAIAFVMFMSAVTADSNSTDAILLSILFVGPYKKLLRTLYECKILYVRDYNPHVEDEENFHINVAACSCIEWIVNMAGALVGISIIVLTIVFFIIGIRGLTASEGTLMNWVISQAISIGFTESIWMVLSAYKDFHGIKCLGSRGEKEIFDDFWRPYFDDRGWVHPVSYSDVARLAKDNYLKTHNIEHFHNKFPSYDRDFHIHDGEHVARLQPDIVEAQPIRENQVAPGPADC